VQKAEEEALTILAGGWDWRVPATGAHQGAGGTLGAGYHCISRSVNGEWLFDETARLEVIERQLSSDGPEAQA